MRTDISKRMVSERGKAAKNEIQDQINRVQQSIFYDEILHQDEERTLTQIVADLKYRESQGLLEQSDRDRLAKFNLLTEIGHKYVKKISKLVRECSKDKTNKIAQKVEFYKEEALAEITLRKLGNTKNSSDRDVFFKDFIKTEKSDNTFIYESEKVYSFLKKGEAAMRLIDQSNKFNSGKFDPINTYILPLIKTRAEEATIQGGTEGCYGSDVQTDTQLITEKYTDAFLFEMPRFSRWLSTIEKRLDQATPQQLDEVSRQLDGIKEALTVRASQMRVQAGADAPSFIRRITVEVEEKENSTSRKNREEAERLMSKYPERKNLVHAPKEERDFINAHLDSNLDKTNEVLQETKGPTAQDEYKVFITSCDNLQNKVLQIKNAKQNQNPNKSNLFNQALNRFKGKKAGHAGSELGSTTSLATASNYVNVLLPETNVSEPIGPNQMQKLPSVSSVSSEESDASAAPNNSLLPPRVQSTPAATFGPYGRNPNLYGRNPNLLLPIARQKSQQQLPSHPEGSREEKSFSEKGQEAKMDEINFILDEDKDKDKDQQGSSAPQFGNQN